MDSGLRLTPNIWLSHQNSKAQLCNAMTGSGLELTSQELEIVAQVGLPGELRRKLQDTGLLLSQADEGKAWEELCSTLLASVDRYLAEVAGCSIPDVQEDQPDPLLRLDDCEKVALKRLIRKDDDVIKDISSLFRNVRTFCSIAPAELSYLPQEFLSLIWQRPNISDDYGQLPCLPDTTERRVDLGLRNCTEKSRCLVLGDDDLLGLAWCLRSQTACDVFELDDRLLEFIETQSLPNLTTFKRDLTQGLRPEHHQKYDVIYTDPMYTQEGMDMFFLCCSQGLSLSPQATIYLTTRPDLIEGAQFLDSRLADVGLKIVNRRVDFSRYRWPPILGRRALKQLRRIGLPRYLLTSLLSVPIYHADMLEVKRIV